MGQTYTKFAKSGSPGLGNVPVVEFKSSATSHQRIGSAREWGSFRIGGHRS